MWNQLFIFLLRALYVLSMEKQFSVEVFPPAWQPLACKEAAARHKSHSMVGLQKCPKDCPHYSQDFLYSKPLLHVSLSLFPPWLHLLPCTWTVLFAQHDTGKGKCWAVPPPATANPIPATSTSSISTWFWAWELSQVVQPVPWKGFTKVRKWKKVRIWTIGFWK